MRKQVFGVSDQIHHKPGCTATEDGKRLEISDLESIGIVLYYLCSENKGADQLRGYPEADLCLCFRICKNPVFSRRGSNQNNMSVYCIYCIVFYIVKLGLTGVYIFFLIFALKHRSWVLVITTSFRRQF